MESIEKLVRVNIIWLLMAAMIMTACLKSGDSEETDIVYDEDKFVLWAGPNDNTVILEFTAYSNWVITLDAADWISVSPMSGGKGQQTVTITLQPNTTGQDRMVSFELETEGEVIATFFTQRGTPMISAKDQSTLTQSLFADETALKAIEITAPDAWNVLAYDAAHESVGALASWLAFEPEQAGEAGDYTVAIHAQQNFTGIDRTAKVVFACGGDALVATVTQKATKADGTKPELNPAGTWACTRLVTLKKTSATTWTSESSVTYSAEEMKDVATLSDDGVFTIKTGDAVQQGTWGRTSSGALYVSLGGSNYGITVADVTVIEIRITEGDKMYWRTYTKVSDSVIPDDDPSAGKGAGKAQYDRSALGLYRGVIVGSSGWIEINILNDAVSASSKVNIDGKTEIQTSSYAFVDGQAVSRAAFTGETVNFEFSVDADGQNPAVNVITIAGHDNVVASVRKETSSTPSQAYEGTVTDPQNGSGVFNIVRAGSTFAGIGKGQHVSGTVDANGNLTGSGSWTQPAGDDDATIRVTLTVNGKFSGSTVSGTWKTSWTGAVSGTNSGTFSGKQTL
jgi:hypothetical protein